MSHPKSVETSDSKNKTLILYFPFQWVVSYIVSQLIRSQSNNSSSKPAVVIGMSNNYNIERSEQYDFGIIVLIFIDKWHL